MTHYSIGLDIGITSVGWSVIALDERDEPCGIVEMGSRIFDAAEQPKTGASLAAPRREARSARRRLRRSRHRSQRIRSLLIRSGLIQSEAFETLFDGKLEDIYALRVRALDEAVFPEDFARILIHLSQRRGFRSNRKRSSGKEDGKLLEAIGENERRMAESGYRTAGELLLKDPLFAEHKRNKGGSYLSTVPRGLVEDEVKKIFAAQRSFGVSFACKELENDYLEILLSQRSFDEGPGGASPYGGDQIVKMVGKCQFEDGEYRAAKAAYSFEYFNLLTHVNHIRLQCSGDSAALTPAQRDALVQLAHKTESLNYSKIRKSLNIGDNVRFNCVRYKSDTTVEDCEKKEKFTYLKAYHQIRKALDALSNGMITLLPRSQLNAIGTAFTLYKTSGKITSFLESEGLEPQTLDALASISGFSGFGHLSLKACDKLIPYLEQGMNYNDACAAAGYNFKGHDGGRRSMLLHPISEDLEDITSPVVRRSVSQTVKVLNAIIRKQGCSPSFLNIELAREMSRDFSERRQIEHDIEENRAKNEHMLEQIRTEYGRSDATGLDLVKFKLYQEQAGVCAYSQKQMSLQHLFEPNYAEVDHIIPYSISFDDSYKNKVLVLTEENRNKGNRLPLQYLTGRQRDDYIVWVNSCVRNTRKRQIMLKESISDDDTNRFKERNLQDTKYMSSFLMNYINDHLEFAESTKGREKHVTAVNGIVTAYLRKRWGISKIREDGDLHHAVDAVVIACTTDGMIQHVSRYAQLRECRYMQAGDRSIAVDSATGEVLREFPYPWPDFRRELEARTANDPVRVISDSGIKFYYDNDLIDTVKPLFVSRMPRRKISGAAHKETVKSAKALDDGFAVAKHPLTDLKLDAAGEIADYYMPGSDRLLYEALKAQLLKFGGSGKQAFEQPFHKPKSDGSPGPVVKTVKLCEKTTLNVYVHGGNGIADNDSMVRADVFHVDDDGYYLVPIYVADTLKPELPNRACVANKPFSQWMEMKDSDFLFSLYPNDLLLITHKSSMRMAKVFKDSTLPETCERKTALMYYSGMNISTGAIKCINHDNTYQILSLGVKSLAGLEKYSVDVLGEYHKVGKETRQPFTMKRS